MCVTEMCGLGPSALLGGAADGPNILSLSLPASGTITLIFTYVSKFQNCTFVCVPPFVLSFECVWLQMQQLESQHVC